MCQTWASIIHFDVSTLFCNLCWSRWPCKSFTSVKIHLVITWHVQLTNHRLNTTQLYLKTTIENDRGFETCNLVLMDKILDYYSCIRFYAFLELQYVMFDRFLGNIEKLWPDDGDYLSIYIQHRTHETPIVHFQSHKFTCLCFTTCSV